MSKKEFPKNYIKLTWSGQDPRGPYGMLHNRLVRFHWWLVFELNGKPCRVGPGATTYYRKTPDLPSEEEVRGLVAKYLHAPERDVYGRQTVTQRIRKLCPLTAEEITALPIVVVRSTNKWPGWRPLGPDHPLKDVKVLGLSPAKPCIQEPDLTEVSP